LPQVNGAVVSDRIRVVPEDLLVSAATVDVHADSVLSRHLAADAQIDAAKTGLPLGTSAALSAAAAKWQAQTTTLFERMVVHGDNLRTAALAYQNTDTDSGAAIDAAGQGMTDLDLGL
jgi:uncharacterized protein YukE